MSVRRARGKFFAVCIVGAFVLGACGGSDSSSNDETTADSTEVVNETDEADETDEATTDTVAEDPAVKLAAFCDGANDQEGSNLVETDDAAALAAKLGENADTLAALAENAPDEVREASESMASVAREMADAVAADPSLEKINEIVQKYATADADAASRKVEEFIKTNCGG